MSKTGLAKAHREPWLVFVDTSVLLRIYESPQPNLLEDLRQLNRHMEFVITTFVVRDEFMRNRHRVMSRFADAVPKLPDAKMVDFARSWPEGKAYLEAKEAWEKAAKTLHEKWRETMENPGKNDHVWAEVHKLLDATGERALQANSPEAKDVLARAQTRLALGNPPGKDGSTLGDAANWEWCLDVCKRKKANLLVLTADGDYGSERRGDDYLPNMMLYDEFQRHVGATRILKITSRTTTALEIIGQSVTDEQKQKEEEALQALNRLRLSSPLLGNPISPGLAAMLGVGASPSLASLLALSGGRGFPVMDHNLARFLTGDLTEAESRAIKNMADLVGPAKPPAKPAPEKPDVTP